ncbi:MAG: S41 family peptidase [Candidatus Woesearchaeota archaeon]
MDEKRPSPNEIIEGMLEVIPRKYSYFAIKQEEFKQAKSVLESKISKITVNSVTDYDALRKVSAEALSYLRDGHIRIVDGQGNSLSTYDNRFPKNYDSTITDTYLSDIQKNGPITLGKIDNIIYIGINSFSRDHKKHFDRLFERQLPFEKKFIIDLRANGGGSDTNGRFLASLMLGAEGPMISSYLRFRTNEENPNELTEFRPRYVMPEPRSFRRQAIVLTGANTYSAAELITMDLAAIPGTILIGDTTGGGSGCPQRYLVDGPQKGTKIEYDKKPNDFQAKFALDIPSWLGYRLDQILVQNNGINPHILIKPQDSIIGNRDCVLEKAIDVHTKGYIAR